MPSLPNNSNSKPSLTKNSPPTTKPKSIHSHLPSTQNFLPTNNKSPPFNRLSLKKHNLLTTSPLNSTLPTQTSPSFTSTAKRPLTTISPKKPLSSKPSTNATNKFNKNHSKLLPGSNNSISLKINSKTTHKNTNFKPNPSKTTNSNTIPWKNSNLNTKSSPNPLKNSKLSLSNPKTSSKIFQRNFFPKINKSN